MKYKIGDKFHVIIPGFSPTLASIDNIKEQNGTAMYYISFSEEHLFTICRVLTERQMDEFIKKYEDNKHHLDDFMMLKSPQNEIEKNNDISMSTSTQVIDELTKDAEISSETEVDFTIQ